MKPKDLERKQKLKLRVNAKKQLPSRHANKQKQKESVKKQQLRKNAKKRKLRDRDLKP